MRDFAPPRTPPDQLSQALLGDGYAVLPPQDVAQWLGAPLAKLEALHADWNALPPDEYLKDGGRYRTRRHACFVANGPQLEQVPHRAHWQPVEYNALHGGMQRWFAPIEAATVVQPVWQRLMRKLADTASDLRGARPWFIEAHQFRIDTSGGIGRPTPEGAHRDGVDLVAVAFVGRHNIKGGETRVFEADGRRGERFTLTEPWTLLLLDDSRVIHESTPIQPLVEGEPGWRDTLVVTCRKEAFQGD
ncbi:2OG-Fe dioxygenase family protein [Variovorax sp. J22R133]|uniref:2OG-Fe dioxygenase family protein n=1 Tax=Variovorax brevis TaxID=3053503 RepID=UPI0025764230|nr:2OG-Fe dioxygenase family protein [Variovorax sp. J22R133]MDM0113105.1 2OG-Fe dioxygenase family protein [Variovorax sp. J22R133]